jgi:hypothetical protein
LKSKQENDILGVPADLVKQCRCVIIPIEKNRRKNRSNFLQPILASFIYVDAAKQQHRLIAINNNAKLQ